MMIVPGGAPSEQTCADRSCIENASPSASSLPWRRPESQAAPCLCWYTRVLGRCPPGSVSVMCQSEESLGGGEGRWRRAVPKVVFSPSSPQALADSGQARVSPHHCSHQSSVSTFHHYCVECNVLVLSHWQFVLFASLVVDIPTYTAILRAVLYGRSRARPRAEMPCH